MTKSFLQSKEWLNFQKSLGRKIFEYDKDGIKAGIIKLPLPFKKSYLYIPGGPEMDFNSMAGGLENPVRNFAVYLRELAKKERAIFVKAEPLNDSTAQFLAKNKFRKSKKEVQPSRTVIIDLVKTEDELLAEMHHKTRYNIKVAEKNGIKVGESENVDEFWGLMRKTTKRDKFSSHTKSYYEKLLAGLHGGEMWAKMFTAYSPFDSAQGKQDKPVAGAIVLFYDGIGYYLHGASDYEFRNLMAPYKLHWEIIKYLKSQAFRQYDLWGIDARRWPGVTRFKLGWGGRTVEHPGSFDLTTSWWWHQGYKLARKVF